MSQSERHAPGHALVVGGGTMGVGIIAMFLGGGWKVDVVSRSASTRDGLPEACTRALVALGKPADTSGLKTYATLPEASWKTIDIVVETVTEDLELKRKLFAEIETLARCEGFSTLVLETGDRHPAAWRVYERAGFSRCGPVLDYPDSQWSVFYQKRLDAEDKAA